MVAITVSLAVWGFTRLEFDFNFRNLVTSEETSFRLDAVIDGLLGYSQAPVAILTRDVNHERATVEALRTQIEAAQGDSTIDIVASTQDLVPADQDEKLEIFEDLAADRLEHVVAPAPRGVLVHRLEEFLL